MKPRNANHSLIDLPQEIQIPVFLIKEELKSRKFFFILQQTGMTDSDFEPHLDSLIFQLIGLNDDDDAISDQYFGIMERRARKITADHKVMNKQALKAYREIVNLKVASDKKL